MKFLTVFLFAAVVAESACEVLLSNIAQPLRQLPLEDKNKKLPYHVGMLVKDSKSKSWCGGSLISNNLVLTSAHCVDGIEEATLYLGSNQLESGEVTHKVKKDDFIIHTKWDYDTIRNNLALVKIPHTKFSENIQPVKLPAKSRGKSKLNYDNGVITSGWGHATNSSAAKSKNLESSLMFVIKNEQCGEIFNNAIKNSNICIRDYLGLSKCRSDPGSPLVVESSKKEYVQIGVLSFVPPSGCEKGVPLVFTRLEQYLPWINKHIKSAKKKN